MKRFLVAALAWLLLPALAYAGADKPLVIESGQIKQLPANTTVQTNASSTGAASINMPHGAAPTSPVNGDCWTTTAGLFCRVNGATVGPYIASAPSGTGGLIGIRYITSGTAATFTPDAGTNSVIVEEWGAGGGGSGVASPGGTNVELGGGGQAGGYLRVRLTTGFSGATYTIGSAGSGGTAGANAGTAGGSTTFTTTGSVTYTAAGGAAPGPLGAFAPPFQYNPAAGNATTGGDISASGAVGFQGFTLGTANGVAQGGGLSVWGGAIGAGLTGTNQSSVGPSAVGFAGGGGGAVATGTGAAKAGGNGSGGIIIIWEYN